MTRTQQRRVDTLSEMELDALDGNPSTSEETRDIIAKERAHRETTRVLSLPPQRVAVVRLDLPFWDIVALMVKWSFAAIPALIILFFAWFGLGAILAVVLRK